MAAELIIFVGLPGSGKSTYFKRFFSKDFAIVSKDLMTGRDKDKVQELQLRYILGAGQNVVVDNTNVTKAIRKPLIELGHSLGCKVTVYWFDTPKDVCLARNALRSGKARVPNVAIYTMAKRFEEPTEDEGFDVRVKITKEE